MTVVVCGRDMGREVLHLTTLEGVSAVELIVAKTHLERPEVLLMLELGAVWSADVAPLPPPAARRCESRMVCACGMQPAQQQQRLMRHRGAGWLDIRFVPAQQLAEIETAREAASAAGIPKVCVCVCVCFARLVTAPTPQLTPNPNPNPSLPEKGFRRPRHVPTPH